MDDRESVRVVETVYDLFEDCQSLEREESAAVDQEVEQFTALHVFEYEIEFAFALEHVVDTEDVWMVHELHDDDFSVDVETLFL